MAYQIDRYNNTLLTVVEDGTVDQTTDLKFIGKNYSGYGEIQNENFLYLLESFAGANQPARPISGQVWFDSSNSKLKFYDGAQFRTTGGSEISTEEPTGLTIGDFWWDSGNDQLYVYNGTNFILIGPQNAGEGVTQMQSIEVLDDIGGTRGVIGATVEDQILFVVSPNEFTLNESTPIDGFDRIKKGITLVNTKLATGGATSTDHYFWGTSSNALKLGGVDASEFVRAEVGSSTIFSEGIEVPDAGVFIGDNQDFQLIVENGDEGVIQNVSGQNSIIKVKVTDSAGTLTHVCTFKSTGLVPAADNQFDIGTSSLRWKEMHAVNFVGEASKAGTLRVGTDFRSASTSSSNNTVAVRDANGNISANLFEGTATQARYADLAEKYTTEDTYETGTVVMVGEDSIDELTAAAEGSEPVGVISAKPAFLMNSDLEQGQAVALKGRVPVRIVGAVSKGDKVYVHSNGVASTDDTLGGIVGIALKSDSNEGEKLVECVLKV